MWERRVGVLHEQFRLGNTCHGSVGWLVAWLVAWSFPREEEGGDGSFEVISVHLVLECVPALLFNAPEPN